MSHINIQLRDQVSADDPPEPDLMTKMFKVKQGLVLSVPSSSSFSSHRQKATRGLVPTASGIM